MKKKNIGRVILISSILIFIGSLIYFGYPYIDKDTTINLFTNDYKNMSDDAFLYTKKFKNISLDNIKKETIESELEKIDYVTDWVEVNNNERTYTGSTICYSNKNDVIVLSAIRRDGANKRDVSFMEPLYEEFPTYKLIISPFHNKSCTLIYSLDIKHDIFIFKNEKLYFLKDAISDEIINKKDLRDFESQYMSFYNVRNSYKNLSEGNGW